MNMEYTYVYDGRQHVVSLKVSYGDRSKGQSETSTAATVGLERRGFGLAPKGPQYIQWCPVT